MNEDGSVGKLNDELYSRTKYHDPADKRSSVLPQEGEPEATPGWQSPSIDSMIASDRRVLERRSFWRPTLNKVFVAALLFCLFAGLAAGYIYFAGVNFISSKNVDITVNGPVSIAAGGVLHLDITISNTNNADLQTTNLGISYPTGTRDPKDGSKSLTYLKESIGEIAAGKEVTKGEDAVIFGEQGEVKDITLTLEYKVKGSNATFSKEKIYTLSVGSVPVTLQVSQPSSVNSGDAFTTTLTLTANSSDVIKNVVVRAEYPYGFTLINSNPATVTNSSNLWTLGDLAPGDKKIITIQGRLQGVDAEERTFRFATGVASASDPNRFDIALTNTTQTIAIERPSVGLDLSLNSDSSPTYVAPVGKQVSASIKVANNMPDQLFHTRIVAILSGGALDRFSIQPQNGGFYDSATNSVTWDEISDPRLATLSAGDEVDLGLQFGSLTTLSPGSKNQEINLKVTVSGITRDRETLSVADTRSVKIASQVILTATPLYSRGPFKNSGPIPPKAEKITTYTITLSLKNTQNDIFKPSVTAVLGPNVKWAEKVSPDGAVVYDSNSNRVIWDQDTLPSGTGFSTPVKEVSFQVSLSPSIGQIGSAPILLNNISFSGMDVFTNSPVSATLPPVTTRIANDPKYVQGDETVVK